MTKFEYSVLRAVPNKRRGEVVNIGIVIYRTDKTDVRVLPILSKVKALDPNVDISSLKDLPESIEKFLPVAEAPQNRMMALKGLGIIDVSDLGWFESTEEAYERNIEKLLDRLVNVPPRQIKKRLPQSQLLRELKKDFSHYSILSKDPLDASKHKIVNNFPILENERLYADFAIRNGVWNITESLDFRTSLETLRKTKFEQAALKALTLDQARRILGTDSIPIVVYSVDPGKEELIQPHVKILGHYAEKIFNYSDSQERLQYLTMMLKAAGRSMVFSDHSN